MSTIISYSKILRDENFKGDAHGILNRLVNDRQELSQLIEDLMTLLARRTNV